MDKQRPKREPQIPARERYGRCPVDAQLTSDAVQRIAANEWLCQDEYGVGAGDPLTGWWSVNWVNTDAMRPGPFEREASDQDSDLRPSK
ncbi:MAG: hypothetical protein ACM3RP_04905 [Chitinophagales bacterium]